MNRKDIRHELIRIGRLLTSTSVITLYYPFPQVVKVSDTLSVVEIGPGPRAGLDKDFHACGSAVDRKLTHPVVWRNGAPPVIRVAEPGLGYGLLTGVCE